MPGPSLLADITPIPKFESIALALTLIPAAGATASIAPVCKRYGPAPLPFIILPIVAALFVDLAKVGLIHLFSQF